MFKKTMRVLFVPRTDSPTKAYYGGLVAGLYLGYVICDQLLATSDSNAFHKGWTARAEFDASMRNLEQATPDSE